MATAMDPYKIFGVQPNAHPDTIKDIYKRRIRRLHPDKNRDANFEKQVQNKRELSLLHLAYQILSDPVKRARYDADCQNSYDTLKSDFDSTSRAQVNALDDRTFASYSTVKSKDTEMFNDGGAFDIKKFNEKFEREGGNRIIDGYITNTEHTTHTSYNPDVSLLLSVPVKPLNARVKKDVNPIDDNAPFGYDISSGGAVAHASDVVLSSSGVMIETDRGVMNSDFSTGYSDYAQAYGTPLTEMGPDPTEKVSDALKRYQQEREQLIAPVESESDHALKMQRRQERMQSHHDKEVERSMLLLKEKAPSRGF
jgi:curved DNA-binding protein CbpA